MKINKSLKNKFEFEVGKKFKPVKTEICFGEDTIEHSKNPVAIIKTDLRNTIGIRKVKRAAQAVFNKFKKSIAYIYIHDVNGEEIALVASDGEWLCVSSK